ncbi:pentachlorophenol 4-monooxygenase [Coprinopsis cinerea AmutBmut pab1-1]|nr:pentachlorophenol 4-monooxygenase [Coprinopsis cinerea AmutBmut pab1-1]
MSLYRPNIRMANSFRSGRVFLVGDAGHAHPPAGAQGMNTSVQDSLSLAWKLNLVVKGLASSELLESYTEERIPVVAEMLNLSTEYLDKALNQCPGEGGEWSRDGALHQLGINYRWSSIVLSDSGCKKTPPIDSYGRVATDVLQPGDRAPDSSGICLVETRAAIPLVISRLSDVYKTTHHTVVIFTGVVDAKTVLMELSRYSGVLIQTVAVVPSEGSTSGSLPSTVDFVFTDTDGRVSQTYTEEGSGLIIKGVFHDAVPQQKQPSFIKASEQRTVTQINSINRTLKSIEANHLARIAACPPVLIVGSGPSGLVLALTLAKNGIPVPIIENQKQPPVGQRRAGIQPRSLELFDRFGLIHKIMDEAAPMIAMRKYKLNSTEVLHNAIAVPHREVTLTTPITILLFSVKTT